MCALVYVYVCTHMRRTLAVISRPQKIGNVGGSGQKVVKSNTENEGKLFGGTLLLSLFY